MTRFSLKHFFQMKCLLRRACDDGTRNTCNSRFHWCNSTEKALSLKVLFRWSINAPSVYHDDYDWNYRLLSADWSERQFVEPAINWRRAVQIFSIPCFEETGIETEYVRKGNSTLNFEILAINIHFYASVAMIIHL